MEPVGLFAEAELHAQQSCTATLEALPIPEEYTSSSAAFYEKGIDEFGFLSHYLG